MIQFGDIILRALEPEDLEILYKWENDTDLWTVSNTLTPYSKYVLRQFIEESTKSIYETCQQRFMIDIAKENVTIGTVDIFDFDVTNQRAGIGILIADEKYRKKGYALQSIRCVTNYCFDILKLHQIYCDIMKTNTESIALFKKAGFVETGTKREWIKTKEGYIDQYIFQLINK